MNRQYSRLGPGQTGSDTPLSRIHSPLSRLDSSDDLQKLPQWQNTFASQNSFSQSRKRGFFGAINGWWLESGSVTLAFCVMLVTVVLLAHYNGKQLSETPKRPSLNTLVNIFSTIEASLLVFVAAEILSQVKWLHMQRSSRLDDFNVIDSASRGMRGAAQVLFKPNLGPMALVGAFATLLAIVIGPMVQETVVLRSAWLPDPNRNASAPISKFFAPSTNPQLPKLDIGLKGTILNGLSTTNVTDRQPAFGCPSGNCTFTSPYTSLGVCHLCQKLELTSKCNGQNTCNYTLANGHVLLNQILPTGVTGDFTFVNVTTEFDRSGPMQGIITENLRRQFDVVRASIISLTNGPLCKTNGTNPDCVLDSRNEATKDQLFNGGAIGAYCDLALCTNTYTAAVSDNRLTEETIGTTDARNTASPQYAINTTDTANVHQADPVILPE